MKSRAALLALVTLAGCTVDNNASVRIHSLCAPPDDATQCVFEATCGIQYIGQILVDVALTNVLWTPVQVDNQRPNNTSLSDKRLDTATAWVREYEVEYEGAALPIARGPILGSGIVPSDGTAVISILPVNATTGNILGGTMPLGAVVDVVAKVKVLGVYGDGTEFETGVFEVPVRVCNGCIVGYACETAGEVPAAFCPPNPGQFPISWACVAP